jgi:hypothetical protein
MKKLTLILILLLGTSVQANPTVSNDTDLQSVQHTEGGASTSGFISSANSGLLKLLHIEEKECDPRHKMTGECEKNLKAQREAKARKKAKKALRKRAEIEYSHRHTSSKWQ